MPKGKTMNARLYIEVLGGQSLNFMDIQGVTVFQNDSAAYHKAKIMTKCLHDKHLNNLRTIEEKVSQTKPSSLEELKTVLIWCRDIDEKMCKKLSNLLPQTL